MTLIVCLDPKNGMIFNQRRQSKDRQVYAKISENLGADRLVVSQYSKSIFPDAYIAEMIPSDHSGDDVCFAETKALCMDALQYAKKLIVYRWDRNYPADFCFPEDLENGRWKLRMKREFPGYSHKIIAEEVYFCER